MFDHKVSFTSLLTAAARAEESLSSRPLIMDPYAGILSGKKGSYMLQRAGKSLVAIAVRTKYFDDLIENAVKRGIYQFVILGSGLDTRPYRLSSLPSHGLWFEIDFESVLEYKRKILECVKTSISIIYIASDILKVNLTECLINNGWELNKPTIFIIEGVIYYLTRSQVDSLFSKINSISLTLSTKCEILFDMPNKSLLKPNFYTYQLLEFLNNVGAPWLFDGIDVPEDFVNNYGFILKEVAFIGERTAHYGRLPFGPFERLPKGFPTGWFIHCHSNPK